MPQSSIIYNISLNNAVQNLLTQMKDAGYSDKTRSIVLTHLRPIQTFMDSDMVDNYSPEVGNRYLESYLQTHKPNNRQRQALTHSIKLLNDSCNGIFIVREKSGVIYNESLNTLVNGLLEQLRLNGYSQNTLKNYMKRLRPIQTFMRRNNIDDYSSEVGDAYYAHFIQTHNVCEVVKSELHSNISRLNDFYRGAPFVYRHTDYKAETIPLCFRDSIERFLNDCSIYSNSKSTTDKRMLALARFLNKCVQCNAHSVTDFTPQIVLLACREAVNTDEWITIRQFLRFLAEHGETVNDLSILVPKFTREKRAPSTYSVEDIRSMEASVDRNTFQGKRDYVVLLMADRLAIRSGDIAAMKKENLDFNNEAISFMMKKTNTEITLPMIPELKAALNDYLNESTINDEYIFHRLSAPYTPLSNCAVNHIINKYFKKAGIDTTGKKHGPHALRASVSTSLINDDVPYEVVRNVLGHTSPNSIRHYAKNDIEKLRRCAIPVPAASGNFQKFLKGGV